MPIGFHPTGNTSLKDDAGRALCRTRQFPPDRPCDPQPGRADGRDRQPDDRRGHGAPSAAARRLPRRHGGLAAWWLWRLDDQWEKFGPGCEHQLSMLPSEYFKRQCYIALDVDEEPAIHAVNDMGAEYFVVSSDYPHSDGAFPEALQAFFGMALTDEQRKKILWDNCARLYAIPTPAGALTREVSQVSAAE